MGSVNGGPRFGGGSGGGARIEEPCGGEGKRGWERKKQIVSHSVPPL